MVLPDALFVCTITTVHTNHEEQDGNVLKLVNGTWYKNARRVITNIGEGTRAIIKVHHNSQVYGHPGIA